MDEDRLAEIAQELVVRVRDDAAEANGRWLAATTTDEERWALLFVLAAAVPDDRPWKHLTLWIAEGQLSSKPVDRPVTAYPQAYPEARQQARLLPVGAAWTI